MNIKVLNIDGSKGKDLKVSDSLAGLKVNNRLLKYVIDWQLNHSKKRVAKRTLQRIFVALIDCVKAQFLVYPGYIF